MQKKIKSKHTIRISATNHQKLSALRDREQLVSLDAVLYYLLKDKREDLN